MSIKKEIQRRGLNLLTSVDQTLYNIATLGNAAPDETASAAAYRMEQEGKWQGKFFRPVIDWIFLKLFNDKNHSQNAYIAEMNGSQRNWINKQGN